MNPSYDSMPYIVQLFIFFAAVGVFLWALFHRERPCPHDLFFSHTEGDYTIIKCSRCYTTIRVEHNQES